MKDQCYQFVKNDFGKMEIVGFGSYGEVKLARNTQDGSVVAIKLLYNKNAKDQIDVHHKLNHPNIIKLLNYYYEKDKNITYMVLEYASGGSLNQRIKFGYGQLNKSLIRKYFQDICEAVKYLHTNNYMHRDIKTQNILITNDNHAKLCDFGFASILEYRSTLCGTFQYMAPEMIQKKPYDYKIDIWALGILLFELIQGFAPFRGDTGEEVITEMKKSLTFSNRFDPVQIDLVKKILRVNAENRPQISKILQHQYFKEDGGSFTQIKDIGDLKEKPIKSLKDLKEEQIKHQLDRPEIKKKDGDKKFDFLQRKVDLKKEEKLDFKNEEVIQKTREVEKIQKKDDEKKESRKEFPKQQNRQESKRQFKPYVPQNFQNPMKNFIKSPTYKPPGSLITTASGFPQSAQQGSQHHFNSSMQVPSSHPPTSFLANQLNPNASMTTNPAKHFPQGPSLPTAQLGHHPNFIKPGGQEQSFEQRAPINPLLNSLNSGSQAQQSYANHSWKKA